MSLSFPSNFSPVEIAVVVVLISVVVLWLLRASRSGDANKNDTDNIPWAPGRIPILGHAIAYRKDPASFMLNAYQEMGDIFQLNLAGKHMIIVAGSEAQRKVAMAPERILSARQAVANIGFEEMLGKLNVYEGTDLHKGIVKGIWQRKPVERVDSLKQSLKVALDGEVNTGGSVELLTFVRKVVLRTCVDEMISPDFLAGYPSFLDEFMSFQDNLEDVTAKGVVLPRWLALPVLLQPVKRRREILQNKIAKRLDELVAASSPSLGFWLSEMYPRFSVKDIAEYVVGLLFAAHKNPAIGASQMYVMMFEHCTDKEKDGIRNDARKLLSNTEKWNDKTTLLHRLCLETLRLTAHSIGSVRTAKEEYEVEVNGRPYTFPVGASIGLAHITLSLQPKLWGNAAAKFDLQAHGLEKYNDEYVYTTFSNGLHRCPGQQFAVVILELIVALLLEEYEISLPRKIPPLSFERATLAQREGPVMVQIVKKIDK